jgi:hypothetical protein
MNDKETAETAVMIWYSVLSFTYTDQQEIQKNVKIVESLAECTLDILKSANQIISNRNYAQLFIHTYSL